MSATNKTNINVIVTTATKLFDERVQFEEAMLARTNKGLYEILAKVYELYIKAVKNDCLCLASITLSGLATIMMAG